MKILNLTTIKGEIRTAEKKYRSALKLFKPFYLDGLPPQEYINTGCNGNRKELGISELSYAEGQLKILKQVQALLKGSA